MSTDLVSTGTDLYIEGGFRPASAAARFAILDPSNEEVLADVADATAADGMAALDAAERVAESWATTPPRARGEILRKAFEIMTARREAIARLIVLENGKTMTDAFGEVAYAAEFFRWFSEEAVRVNGEISTAPSGANKILVLRQPVGIALLITPWNFPAAMSTCKIGPAFAAGCTVVCKPAEDTPLTALAIAGILEEAGTPPGVLSVLPTSRPGDLITPLIADRRVRKISFTGSTGVGKMLLRQAADRVVNASMELGGNAPFLVFDDADIDAAVTGSMIAKMRNGGEACTAANRFYVHESVLDEFSSKLAGAMGALRMGSGLEPTTELGPLVNRKALEKVSELVEGAIDGGAKVLTGGGMPDGSGFFYRPTVLTGVDPSDLILSSEIFGPVAPIVPFADESVAIAAANDTDQGLVSYVYTTDLARALRVAERLEAGMIAINRGLVSDPAAPFGGIKQSGLGREGGHEGIDAFLESKYIATTW